MRLIVKASLEDPIIPFPKGSYVEEDRSGNKGSSTISKYY